MSNVGVFIPKIHTPIDINDMQIPQNGLNLVFCPYTQTKQDFVQKIKSSTNFNIFIGPEGGFSDREMTKFHSNNFYLYQIKPVYVNLILK